MRLDEIVVVTVDPLFIKGILSHFLRWEWMRLDGMVVVTVDLLFRKNVYIFAYLHIFEVG